MKQSILVLAALVTASVTQVEIQAETDSSFGMSKGVTGIQAGQAS